jgi:hypothetical protein
MVDCVTIKKQIDYFLFDAHSIKYMFKKNEEKTQQMGNLHLLLRANS